MAGCHSYILFIVAVIILLASAVSQVDASATLQLLVVRFENPNSKNKGGARCDVGSQCDHYFKFSINHANSDEIYWSQKTGHFGNKDTVEFGEDMQGVKNPIVTSFATWPSVGVRFKVVVKDNDNGWFNNDDSIDNFDQLLQPTPALNGSSNWTVIVMQGLRRKHKTRLTIEYILYCDDNYYSSDCSVYCVANDTDADGHYTCDPITGNITCRPGWEDEATNCITLSNDCLNHTCVNGATCIDDARTYTCLCLPGYTGVSCETDVNECVSSPCQHGGTCEDQVNGFTCSCLPPFTGALCSDVYQTTDDTVNTTSPFDNEATSSKSWLYGLICAICIIFLVVVVLIVLLCTRRRKAASATESHSSAISQSSSASSSSRPTPLPPSQPECAAAAGVTIHVSNKLYHEIENLNALSNQQDNSGRNAGNVYESIDYAPTTCQSLSTPLSPPPAPLLPSPPIATAEASANIYDSIDDVPVVYQSLSPSSSSRPTLPPSAPEAVASFSVDADNVYLHPISCSDDDSPTTSQPSSSSSQPTSLPPSAPEAAAATTASFDVDADSVYVQTDNVPCVYQLEPITEQSNGAYVNYLPDPNVDKSEA